MRPIRSSNHRGPISFEPLESRQFFSVTLPAITGLPQTSTTPVATTTNAIKGIGLTFNATAEQEFTGLVGELSGVASTTGLNASIDWGDGTSPSAGKFIRLPSATSTAPGLLGIAGQHTYSASGTYAVTITVTDQLGPPGAGSPVILLLRINSKAVVAPESGQGVTLYEPANQQFTATLGTFNYNPITVSPVTANPVNPVLVATINWGDGQISRGLVQHVDGNQYAVIGTHEYTAVGQYTVHVVVGAYLVPPPVVNRDPTSGSTPPRIIAEFDSTIIALPSPAPAT